MLNFLIAVAIGNIYWKYTKYFFQLVPCVPELYKIFVTRITGFTTIIKDYWYQGFRNIQNTGR